MKKNNKIKKIILTLTLFIPQIAQAADYIVCDNDKKFPYIFAQITSTAMTIIKIVIPILLVITGMISFFKVTIASNVEDEMKKAKSKLINSIIAAVVIFFTFSIVNFVVTLVAGTNNKFMGCVECFVNVDKCNKVTEEGTKICTGLINGEFDENCNPINQEEHSPQEFKRTTVVKVDKKATTTTTGTGSVVAGTSVTGGVTAKAKDVKITTTDGVTYANGVLIVNKTYSLPSTYGPSSAGNGECNNESKCFTAETWNAYSSMKLNAKSFGIDITIGSGYRSYNTQNIIYNNNVAKDGKDKADTYSARPGNSEHQTGLAMDICATNNNNACINDKFNDTKEAKWLNDNAYQYGFILRYPQGKQGITGYKYESWHYRYVGKELAKTLYNNGNWITLEEYFGLTSKYQ